MNGTTTTEIDQLWNQLQSAGMTGLKPVQIDTEQAYLQVRLMIFDAAHRAHEKYNIPPDDAISIAHMGFMAACKNFDGENTTKFSSFAYIKIHGYLMDHARTIYRRPVPEELDEETAGFSNENRSETLEVINDLSSDAQEIVRLLLDTPREIIGWGDVKAPSRLLKAVKEYMIKNGWSKSSVNQAVQEIKTKFREAWAV